MTKSSRQAAIAGYLKRDDGIDWKGLTDYANSMYDVRDELEIAEVEDLSLIHISEPTRPEPISYAVFCLTPISTASVSYTHLTLPTILLV